MIVAFQKEEKVQIKLVIIMLLPSILLSVIDSVLKITLCFFER